MTHCKGCGGAARDVPSKDFVHVIGCGWSDGRKEDRHTPSMEEVQKTFIAHAMDHAVKKQTIEDQVETFIRHLKHQLDDFNMDRPTHGGP